MYMYMKCGTTKYILFDSSVQEWLQFVLFYDAVLKVEFTGDWLFYLFNN